jgi:Zn-dependent peptidase ImmA (M78 family)/transcriptional regulator with XRE-family HTH domain
MFNCSKLALARKRRQLTKKDLAEKSGITAVTLTRLETGKTSDPSMETLAALAEVLGYPVDFFFGESYDELTTDAASFRSLSTMSAAQRDAALAAGQIAFSLAEWINSRFDLPVPNLPNLREDDPISAAGSVRNYWGIGSKPIPKLLTLLEAKGVRVFTLAERNKNVDAFSCWKNGIPYIFLNTFKSSERTRFDAAHELGHLLMHRHTPAGHMDGEKEADMFAAAFLIPQDDLISHMPRVHSLKQLVEKKERWGVSVAALARTAFNNNLVSDWHYRELCKQMSMLGYRTEEPRERIPEKSAVWQKVLELLWKDGVTKSHIAKELCLPIDEIEALIGPLVSIDVVNQSTDFKKLSLVR